GSLESPGAGPGYAIDRRARKDRYAGEVAEGEGMDEREWLACTDPQPMLDFLKGKASDRKFRLFAVACCRGIWAPFTHEACKQAVEAAEMYGDGLVTEDELWAAHDDAQRFAIFGRMEPGGRMDDRATWTAIYASNPDLCAYKDDGRRLSPSWVV